MDFENETEGLNCAQKSLLNMTDTDTEFSPAFRISAMVLEIMFYSFEFIAGIILNFLVIVAIAACKLLWTHSFMVVLQVVTVDLLLAILVPVIIISSTTAGHWLFDWQVCVCIGFIIILYIFIRTLLIAILVVDRFLIIFAPFAYQKMETKAVIFLSGTAWVLAIAVCILFLPGMFDCYGYNSTVKLCCHEASCGGNCVSMYAIIFVGILSPSCIVPFILHILLVLKDGQLKTVISTGGNAGDGKKHDFKVTMTLYLSNLFLLIWFLSVTGAIKQSLIDSSVGRFTVNIVSAATYTLIVVVHPLVVLHHQDAKPTMAQLKNTIFQKVCFWCHAPSITTVQIGMEQRRISNSSNPKSHHEQIIIEEKKMNELRKYK